jgi:hypothetical protein
VRVDVTKNTWINEVQVDFFREGFWAGLYAVSISFSGGSLPSEALLAELLQKLLKLDLPKQLRVVRFTGLFDPRDPDITLFIHSLHKYGFTVQAVIPERFSAPWLEKIDWKIVRTEGEILYQDGSEFWYCPKESTNLKEPTLPKQHGLLYIIKGRSMVETIKFICDAKETWRLL